jgi:N-acetylmuramoyl-L-alanine amidase
MNNKAFIGCLVLAFSCAAPVLCAAPEPSKSPDGAAAGKRVRLVMNFATAPKYRVTRWADPNRLLIDLESATLVGGIRQAEGSEQLVSKVGFAPTKSKDKLRVLVDLKSAVDYKVYPETVNNRSRLVVELAARSPFPPSAKNAPPKPQIAAPSPGKVVPPAKTGGAAKPAKASGVQSVAKTVRSARPERHFVVAIDAGHGGKDTGALGPNGTREKDVVLAIARRLADFVRAEPGMKPVMVRNGDHFVDLRHRVNIARKNRADLFVSLHADAYVNDLAKGSSVFTLSDSGATSEAARWLADRENASFVGGVKLKDKDKTLASVLLDLSQGATLDASDRAARRVLRELKKGFHIHHHNVQKAGFVVLKSPDIPSVLVETAFISNPDEERNLRDPEHQTQIARAVFRGIRAYFADRRPVLPAALRVADAGDSVGEAGGKQK